MQTHTPNQARIDDAIAYLVQQYRADIVFTRTKLMKLLYLADKQYHQDNHGTITGVAWSKYHYGPYSDTVVDRSKALNGDRIHIDAYQHDETGTQYHHRPCSRKPPSTDALTSDMIECLNAVLTEHALRDTTDIVEDIVATPLVANTAKYGIIPLKE